MLCQPVDIAVRAGRSKIETNPLAVRDRETAGGPELFDAFRPVAHRWLVRIAVGRFEQNVIEEGQGLALPGVDRQLIFCRP